MSNIAFGLFLLLAILAALLFAANNDLIAPDVCSRMRSLCDVREWLGFAAAGALLVFFIARQ